MKIGILQTAYKKASDYGAFYNVQELGLARAFARAGDTVMLYKAVDGHREAITEEDGRLTITFLDVKYYGINGMASVDALDTDIDVLIYFCDTQIIVPKVYKWCCRHNIKFVPYVGVVNSHSENAIKRLIMNALTKRNIRVYRKGMIFAKTPLIKSELTRLGCPSVKLIPVGLDETVMMNEDIDRVSENESTKLLFVGRMEEEKHPLEMLDIYDRLLAKQFDKKLSLTMIGSGYMLDEVRDKAGKLREKYKISEDDLRIIDKVPYQDMYRFYLDADMYINLNRVEILGMSILEAMYYKCPVVAIDAPGPRFLLEDDNTHKIEYGYIASDEDGVIDRISELIMKQSEELEELKQKAKNQVVSRYVWTSIVNIIKEML